MVRVSPGALTRHIPCSRAGDGRCPGDFAQPGQSGRRRVAAPPGSAAERSVWRSSLEPLLSSRALRSRSQPSPEGSWALPEGRRAAPRSCWAGPETWSAGAGRPRSSPGAPRLSAPGLACCLPAPPSAVAPPQGRPRPLGLAVGGARSRPLYPTIGSRWAGRVRGKTSSCFGPPRNRPTGSRHLPAGFRLRPAPVPLGEKGLLLWEGDGGDTVSAGL